MRSRKSAGILLMSIGLSTVALLGNRCPGLNFLASLELHDAGVSKYSGEFVPTSSEDVGDGWTKHTLDPDGGNGPICIAGTPFSAFTRAGNPSKLLDPNFPFGPVRFHRGLRNQTAAIDLAKATFPRARRITISGSSGVGATAFTPLLARFAFGNHTKLTVLNGAGPVTANLDDTVAVEARAADWDFGKFYPASCTACDDLGQSTALIDWRLANDSSIREAFYETDGDQTNRFFLGLLFDPVGFRNLIVTAHGELHDAYPERYKRFIVAGDISHTALQTSLFYTQQASGMLLNDWTEDFLKNLPSWEDIVPDPVY